MGVCVINQNNWVLITTNKEVNLSGECSHSRGQNHSSYIYTNTSFKNLHFPSHLPDLGEIIKYIKNKKRENEIF